MRNKISGYYPPKTGIENVYWNIVNKHVATGKFNERTGELLQVAMRSLHKSAEDYAKDVVEIEAFMTADRARANRQSNGFRQFETYRTVAWCK